MSRRICVIGAGVCGISAALHVQQTLPNVHVTIVTEHVTPNTTGDGSAGFWEPHLLGDTPLSRVRRWGTATYDHLASLARDADAATAGVFVVSGYTLFRTKHEDPFWKDIPPGFRHMTEKELSFHPGFEFGYYNTSVVAEVKKYLPWSLKRFLRRGGKLIRKKINRFEELTEYDVIVNCTGIGARELCADSTVVPVQGQVLRVYAPWIKHFLITEEDAYVLIGADSIILGGTAKVGAYGTDVDIKEKERIWNDCCRLIPSLKHARHLGDWVGRRPTRPEVRLERQDIVTSGKVIKVVHNYGHGGAGVTLHWGCAQDAAQLVKEALTEHTPRHAKL